MDPQCNCQEARVPGFLFLKTIYVRVLLKEMTLQLVLNIHTRHSVVITCLVPDTPNQSLFQNSKAQNNIIHTTEVTLLEKVNKMCVLGK